MKHRVLLPVLLKLINSQAAEQLAPTAEISVKCACQKALAETAGPGKKHILIFLGYIKDIPGLVNVKPGSLAYLRESLYAYRIFHPVRHHSASSLFVSQLA